MRLVCVRLRKSLCAYRRRSCLGCVCMRACGSMSAVCVRACAYVHLHVCAYVCARAYAQTHVRAFVRGSVRGGAVAHISRSASMKRVWMSFTNSSERYSEIGTRLLKRIRDVTNLCIRRVHVCACVCVRVRVFVRRGRCRVPNPSPRMSTIRRFAMYGMYLPCSALRAVSL